jgi:hypothetical protein
LTAGPIFQIGNQTLVPPLNRTLALSGRQSRHFLPTRTPPAPQQTRNLAMRVSLSVSFELELADHWLFGLTCGWSPPPPCDLLISTFPLEPAPELFEGPWAPPASFFPAGWTDLPGLQSDPGTPLKSHPCPFSTALAAFGIIANAVSATTDTPINESFISSSSEMEKCIPVGTVLERRTAQWRRRYFCP